MVLQKEMIADHFERLERGAGDRRAGGLHLRAGQPDRADPLVRRAARCCRRSTRCSRACAKQSGDYIAEAERAGHSEDVCTYVKCDIGMMQSGNIGPTGTKLPKPDLLLLSYTGCFTFMKWFELLREEYDCPTVMLHVPYQGDGKLEPEHREYMVAPAARDR